MKKLLLILALAGCDTPVVKMDGMVHFHQRVVAPPEPPRTAAPGSKPFDYWHTPVTVIERVENGTTFDLHLNLECVDSMPTVDIKPGKYVELTVSTTMDRYYKGPVCRVFKP